MAEILVATHHAAEFAEIATLLGRSGWAAPGVAAVRVASSTLECEVTTEERGSAGHSYDALVQLQDRKTLAEHDDNARSRLGHRGMALRQLLKQLAVPGDGA